MSSPRVAVVDLSLGNLFSVRVALEKVGLSPEITSSIDSITSADAVVLPGVGAFGAAMERMREQKLDQALMKVIDQGTPFMGICLGMQLLMKKSSEFGDQSGMGIVQGVVHSIRKVDQQVKVPHVGWATLEPRSVSWSESSLRGITEEDHLYFVHSFMVQLDPEETPLSLTHYGDATFCSSYERGNLFACQFHPERSGEIGLQIYQNFANGISSGKKG